MGIGAWGYGTGATTSAAHPFSLTIQGIDIIDSVPRNSISVSTSLASNATMEFVIEDEDNSMTIPPAYADVLFTEHGVPVSSPAFESTAFESTAFQVSTATVDIDQIVFSGLVIGTEITPRATGRLVGVKCVDYGYLLDKAISRHAVTLWGPSVIAPDDWHAGDNAQAIAGALALGPVTAIAADVPMSAVDGRIARMGLDDGNICFYYPLNYVPSEPALQGDVIAAGQSGRALFDQLSDNAWYFRLTDVVQHAPLAVFVDPERRLNVWPVGLTSIGPAPAVIVEGVPGTGEANAANVTYVSDYTNVVSEVIITDTYTSDGDDSYFSGSGGANGYSIGSASESRYVTPDTSNDIVQLALTRHGTVERGTFDILATTDNWRVGQRVTITSPGCGLSADEFLIHAVRTDFLGGQIRRCYVEFGAIRASGARNTRAMIARAGA